MRPFGPAIAIALLAACSGSTSVRPFGGTYDLVSVNGRPDPQPLDTGATTQIVSGTLDAGADTLDVTLQLQSLDASGHGTGSVTPERIPIPYVRHGDSLLIQFDTTGSGGGLSFNGNGQIGAVIGNDVEITLFLGSTLSSSTGFSSAPSQRLLFAPER